MIVTKNLAYDKDSSNSEYFRFRYLFIKATEGVRYSVYLDSSKGTNPITYRKHRGKGIKGCKKHPHALCSIIANRPRCYNEVEQRAFIIKRIIEVGLRKAGMTV